MSPTNDVANATKAMTTRDTKGEVGIEQGQCGEGEDETRRERKERVGVLVVGLIDFF